MEPPAQKSCPRPVMHSAPKKEDGTSLPTSPLAAQSVPLSHAQPASAPPQPAVSGDPPSSETLLTSMLEELDTDVPAALPAAHAAAESVPRTPPAAVLPAEQGVVGCAPTPSAASPAQPAQPAPAPQRKPPPPVWHAIHTHFAAVILFVVLGERALWCWRVWYSVVWTFWVLQNFSSLILIYLFILASSTSGYE